MGGRDELHCTETTATRAGDELSFTVEAGDNIVCTFTNVKDATIKVIKDADPNDAQDFDFDGSGGGIAG